MAPPIITQRRGGGAVTKPFSWSYSRLKNFESCPKKHWHVDIAKDFKEEESQQLADGNAAHDALARRISAGVPIPPGFGQATVDLYEAWAARVSVGQGEHNVAIYVEQKLCITKEFTHSGYFDKGAWFRGIGDVIKVVMTRAGGVALVVDWKTGKIIEDSVQLALMAQCIFATYPVDRVRSEFVWLKEDASTSQTFSRADMPEFWAGLWPRIEQLEHAHNTTTYPAKPGGLCKKYCPVRDCPYYGKGA